MGVNLLTYEVGICLDVFETSDSAIVGHTEYSGAFVLPCSLVFFSQSKTRP